MTEKIPVNLKYTNPRTETNDHLLPTTRADLVEEYEAKQFISQAEKNRFEAKQDAIGYVPVNQNGDIMQGPLILSQDEIVSRFQAATKEYVDNAIARVVNGAPEALDTLYELAEAIGADPNFAISITTVAGSKIDKEDATVVAEPNKILYLDGNGELNTNAASASRLKDPFEIAFAGDIQGSAQIDGSSNVSVDILIPEATDTEIDRLFPPGY